MATDGRFRRLLIWAAVGGILSLFLSHPPPEHIDPVDRIADRAVGICVWALLGAIASIVYTFFKRTSTPAISQSPEQRTHYSPDHNPSTSLTNITPSKENDSETDIWLYALIFIAVAILIVIAMANS